MKNVLIVLCFVFSSIASATNYFVSSSSGDDTRDGRSEATAWKTISKINAGSFSPGDIIAFKKGDIWRETLEVPGSGTSGNYIHFASYGSGINPGIYGSKATTTWTNQGGNLWKSDATFTNPRSLYPNYNDITFQYSSGNFRFGTHKANTGSLTTEYDYVWSANYIYVYAASNPGTRYIGIEVPQRSFCVSTNDKGYLHFDGIDILYAANTGMDSNNDHTVTDVTGCIIENCEIGFIGGTSDQQYGFGIAIAYSDLTIRNCKIHHCGRRGISINMEYTASPYTIENILIENNTFYGGSHTTSLDMTVNNGGNSSSINGVIFRFNLVYEDPTSAVSYPVNQMWFQRYNGTGSTTNVNIYSNIFKSWRNNCISSEGFNGYIYVYNNTFYENNTTTTPSYCYYADTDRGTAHHVLKNNIFYTTKSTDGSGNGALIVLMLPSSYLTCNYNLFYRINNNIRVWLINGSSYYMNQIATIRSAFGWEANSPTPANPLFTSTSDYQLQAGSPALGKGISIPGILTDFEGNLWNSTPNIGCYSSSVTSTDPVYTSSVVENATPSLLAMTYNLNLANIVPAVSAFNVLVNSIVRTINSVAIVSGKAQLTLASALRYGDVVTVAYTKPALNPLQTTSGGQAANCTATSVTNNCTPPISVYTTSIVENATPSLLALTYNLSLANIVPATSAFNVMVNSVVRTINSVAIVSGKAQLTLASALRYGDVVTVAYTKPALNPLQTTSGGQAANCTAKPVTNNCTPPIPVHTTSVVENATPSLLALTYNLSLANIVPAVSAFNVMVNSVVRTINSVAIVSGKAQLTLASALRYGDVVTVAYTKPALNPLQTTSGGQAANCTAKSVTNNCTLTVPADSGSVYYVSNTNGNDGADGHSEGTAWKTISKVNSKTFIPGDKILLKKGDVWRETLEVPGSGTIGKYQYFGSYGIGVNPGILGSGISSVWTNQGGNIWKSSTAFSNPNNLYPGYCDLTFINSDNSKLFGTYKASMGLLVAEYNWTWSANYIYVYATSNPTTKYTSVEIPQRTICVSTNDHEYLHFDGIDVSYSTWHGYNSNDDQADMIDINGLIIENCEVAYIGGGSASSDNQSGFGISTVYSDLIIRHCTIHHCGRRGISLDVYGNGFIATNAIIEDNVFYGGYHATALDVNSGSGSYTGGWDGIIFRRNLVYEDASKTMRLRDNQIFLQRYGSTTLQNIYIYSNIFKFPGGNSVSIEHANNVYIYNNTFYGQHTSVSPSYHIYADTDPKHLTIKNNLFYTLVSNDTYGNGAEVVLYGVTNSEVDIDYNLYYRINNRVRIILANGASYYMNNKVTIISNLGWETKGVFADPLFVSASDYHLRAGSPAIGKGISIPGITTDFEGNLWNGTPNIGCYSSSVTLTDPLYVNSIVENPAPNVIEMNYNLSLANIVPAASAFTVQVNSVNLSGNLVDIAGGKVRLDLEREIVYGDTVTVSYFKPELNPLQTPSGGEAESITIQSVINNIQDSEINKVKNDISRAEITIYPIPAHEYFNIFFSEPVLKLQTIRIINRSGATLFEDLIETGISSKQFPIQLSSGLYFVQLISDGIIVGTYKLIVSN